MMAENRETPFENGNTLPARLADEEYCYLTTTGRTSGRLHEIEIWFGVRGNSLYLLSGSRDNSDWVKNLLKNPSVAIRIADHTFHGKARIVTGEEEERMARYLLAEKYQEWEADNQLSEWARTALPVAIDLTEESS
jgi:deazaflavin-dependent oxidoreductase (nitroreductase family)